jgi:hypothetical protein
MKSRAPFFILSRFSIAFPVLGVVTILLIPSFIWMVLVFDLSSFDLMF